MRKILWAPWRMEYILGEKKDKGCIFCTLPKENNDKENLIIFRSKFSFVIMNKYPYNNGHLMVVPYNHVNSLEKLNEGEFIDIFNLMKRSIKALEKTFKPQGLNIGINIGKAAGAGIDTHVHVHIVPRWIGDTNFIPVFSDCKVISDYIANTYEQLLPNFNLD